MARPTLRGQLAEHREIILQLTSGMPGACQDVSCLNCNYFEMGWLFAPGTALDKVSLGDLTDPPVRICRRCGHVQRVRPPR